MGGDGYLNAAGLREFGEAISDVSEALGLFHSCIKSGEAWSSSCDEVLVRARAGLSKLGIAAMCAHRPLPEPPES